MEKNREKDRIIAGKDRTIVELNSKIDQMAGLSRQQQNIARRRQTARKRINQHQSVRDRRPLVQIPNPPVIYD